MIVKSQNEKNMKIIAQKEKKKYLVDGELKNENVIESK